MAELAPAAQEVADLRVREKDARDDAHEAEEKLAALIETVHGGQAAMDGVRRFASGRRCNILGVTP